MAVSSVALCVLLIISPDASSEQVVIDSGAALIEASAKSLATFDAFASNASEFVGMSLAQGSGCTLSGMSMIYIYSAVAVQTVALGVDVNELNTTVTAEGGIARKLHDVYLGDLVGTHGNNDFLSRVCSHPATFWFPNACSFFAPSNLATLCFAFAPLLHRPTGRAFGPLYIDDPFLIHTTDPHLLHSDLRFDLQSSRGSPCTPTGFTMQYVVSGEVFDLQITATPTTVRVGTSTLMTKILVQLSQGGLVGVHSYENFLQLVCTTVAKQRLPNACDFFAPSHMGAVCPAMSPLLRENAFSRNADYIPINGLPAAEDPFMLRPAQSTSWFSARSSPCTSTGLVLKYFDSGVLALQVEVLLDLITATASDTFRNTLSTASLSDILGTQQTSAFRMKVCREEGKHLFPYACTFFGSQHLGSLCSPLEPLLVTSAKYWNAWWSEEL